MLKNKISKVIYVETGLFTLEILFQMRVLK